MRQEADVYAEEDSRRKKVVELRNRAESLLYSYETTLRDNGELISEELKTQAAAHATELKAAISSASSPEEIATPLDNLQKTLYDIGADIYRQKGDQPPLDGDYDDNDDTLAARIPRKPFPPDGDDSFDDDATVTADYEAVD
jgi:molecular chaperone DnaK